MIACTESAVAVRSANGFNRATMNAEFGSEMPSNNEKPMIDSVSETCGTPFRICSTCAVTSLVRETEAPSGS